MPHRLRLTALFSLCFAAAWSELYPWRRFDLQPTSTTHLVGFLHKQQTPLFFTPFLILPLSFFFFPFIWTFIQMSPPHLLRRRFSPICPSAYCHWAVHHAVCPLLLYAAESADAKQSGRHAAAAAAVAPNRRGSRLPFLTLNKARRTWIVYFFLYFILKLHRRHLRGAAALRF